MNTFSVKTKFILVASCDAVTLVKMISRKSKCSEISKTTYQRLFLIDFLLWTFFKFKGGEKEGGGVFEGELIP